MNTNMTGFKQFQRSMKVFSKWGLGNQVEKSGEISKAEEQTHAVWIVNMNRRDLQVLSTSSGSRSMQIILTENFPVLSNYGGRIFDAHDVSGQTKRKQGGNANTNASHVRLGNVKVNYSGLFSLAKDRRKGFHIPREKTAKHFSAREEK